MGNDISLNQTVEDAFTCSARGKAPCSGRKEIKTPEGTNGKPAVTTHMPARVDVSLFEHADLLYSHDDAEGALQILTVLARTNWTAALLWRLVRCYTRLGDVAKKTDKALFTEYAGKAMEYAAAALDLDDECCEVHNWYGVAVNLVAETQGVQQMMKAAAITKVHWEKAVQLNPTEPFARHLYGIWIFTSAMIPWSMRLMITKEKMTFEMSLQQLLLCDKLVAACPDVGLVAINLDWGNKLMLAACYRQLKDKEAARRCLEHALEVLPCETTLAQESREEARKILRELDEPEPEAPTAGVV